MTGLHSTIKALPQERLPETQQNEGITQGMIG